MVLKTCLACGAPKVREERESGWISIRYECWSDVTYWEDDTPSEDDLDQSDTCRERVLSQARQFREMEAEDIFVKFDATLKRIVANATKHELETVKERLETSLRLVQQYLEG